MIRLRLFAACAAVFAAHLIVCLENKQADTHEFVVCVCYGAKAVAYAGLVAVSVFSGHTSHDVGS